MVITYSALSGWEYKYTTCCIREVLLLQDNAYTGSASVTGQCVYEKCFCYRTMRTREVLLLQDNAYTGSASATGQCVYGKCFCYRTMRIREVLLLQDNAYTRSASVTGQCVYGKCFCYRTMHAVSFLSGNTLDNVMCVYANSLVNSQKQVMHCFSWCAIYNNDLKDIRSSLRFHFMVVLVWLAPHIAQTKMAVWSYSILWLRLCPPMISEATTANSGEVGNEGNHSVALNHFRSLICTSKTH